MSSQFVVSANLTKSNKTKSYDEVYYRCSIFSKTAVQVEIEKRLTASIKQRV